MSVVELNAVTSVRQNLGYETLEFQEVFLRHIMFLCNAVRVAHGRAPAGPVLCRLPLWPIEVPSIVPSFHESSGRWPDIPSSPLRRLWRRRRESVSRNPATLGSGQIR